MYGMGIIWFLAVTSLFIIAINLIELVSVLKRICDKLDGDN